jgi:uncharacterized protein YndB with AHSA1/START domain
MNRTVVHDTFVIQRVYAASPARVFSAFADPAAKARWFGDTTPDLEKDTAHLVDFRIGGRESLRGDAPGGVPTFTYDAVYQDIVDNERIVYSYEMTLAGRRISVSVATIELIAAAKGTQLILTEQGAYLDGLDTNAAREHGTGELLDALGRYLAQGDSS